MSTLAKIFVVFNLVLTLIYFGSAGALFYTRKNYLDIYQQQQIKHKNDNENLAQKMIKQKAQIDMISQNYSRVSANNTDLVAKLKNLETEKHGLDTKLTDKEQQVKSANDAMTQSQKTNQDLQTNVARIEKDRDDAKKHSEESNSARQLAIGQVTRLKLDYDKLNSQHSMLQQSLTELQGKAEEMEIVIANIKAKYPTLDIAGMQYPSIPGTIEAVNEKDKLVVLSVGKDQKVEEGYQFYVRRGAEFIGKVTVIKVYEDLSGARVEHLSPNKSIEVGDQINTSFN